MQPSTNQDYKQLLTDVIKKQIVILGPDITLSKARNVKGLTVADDGTVTNVEGQPQEVIQALIDQFVQLSGLIVKKTMEPLLSLSQPAPEIAQPAVIPQIPIPPVPTLPQSPIAIPTAPAQPAAPTAAPSQPAIPTTPPALPTETPTSPTPPTPQANTNPAPASNPLAA